MVDHLIVTVIFMLVLCCGAIACSLYWHKEYFNLVELVKKANKYGCFD